MPLYVVDDVAACFESFAAAFDVPIKVIVTGNVMCSSID